MPPFLGLPTKVDLHVREITLFESSAKEKNLSYGPIAAKVCRNTSPEIAESIEAAFISTAAGIDFPIREFTVNYLPAFLESSPSMLLRSIF